MRPRNTVGRRTALRAVASGGAAALAGCLSGEGTSTVTSRTPTATGVFEDVFFDAQDMVVDLEDDAEVSQVNLIGPDGSQVAGTNVPTGATRVRLQILEIDPGLGGYDHYSPGEYELVAQLDGGTHSMAAQFQPSLVITDVNVWRSGPDTDRFGKIAVGVTNTGTAPTWVYDITYENAPNRDVNDELVDTVGVPQIANHEEPENFVVEPQSEAVFVGLDNPLVFRDQDEQDCSGATDLTVIVGTAVGERLEQDVQVTNGGSPISVGLTGQYVCAGITVEPKTQTTSERLQGVSE